jgi:hypothetical protein
MQQDQVCFDVNAYEGDCPGKYRFVFWDVLPIALMIEAARTSETSVDNYFTRQYIPEDKSELHTRRRENLKSHISWKVFLKLVSRFISDEPHSEHSCVLRFNMKSSLDQFSSVNSAFTLVVPLATTASL